MSRRTTSFLAALVLSLVLAAPATARPLNLGERILVNFTENGSRIDACKFSTSELKKAKNAIPEDLEQYGASLIAALDDAIAARAQGACNKKKPAQGPAVADQGAAAPPPTSQTPPPSAAAGAGAGSGAAQGGSTLGQAQAPPTPNAEPIAAASIAADDSIVLAADTTDVGTDAPFPVLLLAIVAALLAAGALAFAFVRWFAWEPVWAVHFRHAAGEAGWRASSTFSEFADFVRLGR